MVWRFFCLTTDDEHRFSYSFKYSLINLFLRSFNAKYQKDNIFLYRLA